MRAKGGRAGRSLAGDGKLFAGQPAIFWSSAAALALACAPAVAQQPNEPDPLPPLGELDPTAPLDPMPDLGVDWPEIGEEPAPTAESAAPGVDPVPQRSESIDRSYSVQIDGLEGIVISEAIAEAFEAQSTLREYADDAANAAQIERRSVADAELLAELLRSQGYYDASVEPRIDTRPDSLLVVLEAEPGDRYSFASVELPGLSAAGEDFTELREAFAVKEGDPVVAADVIAAGLSLKIALGEEGFAFAEVGERDVVIDHERRTASLTLPVDPGPRAKFGKIRVEGRPPFPASHVATIARFDPGDEFRRSRVDDLRRALIATGLVASAEVAVEPADDGRTVDLAVRLEPAPPRTIAGELGYGTGEGARIEGSWQHRNFINPEGALTLRGVLGTREQVAAVEFRRNNFRGRDRALNLQALASNVDRDAYEARTISISAGLERESTILWPKTWTWGVGTELIATDERGVFSDSRMKQNRAFLIGALSAHLRYDQSDDLFNPTRGYRLGIRVSPEYNAKGGGGAYGKVQLDGSVYRPVSDSMVLAGRIRLATIAGTGLGDLAPSRRLYSGGGGSVRGYGYQELGPKDLEGDPIGGRGLAEFGLEVRKRLSLFGGNFGIVPFLDGGSLSTRSTPDFSGWQFGAGIGLRYYSSFGPIRIDVGTPLNPKDGDAPVAVTVSLGQAF